MKHVIGKQVIELQVGTDQDAYSLQNQFSKMYWEDLVPAMEKLFDELATGGEYIAIDKMEIDLGTLATIELQKDSIIPLLRQEVEKWFQNNKTQSPNINRKPNPQGILEKWLFYLDHGSLPWSLKQLPENWTTIILENLTANKMALQNLRTQILKNQHSLTRLIQQHDAVFLQKMIELFTAHSQTELTPFLETIKGKQAVENFWKFAIEKTIVEQNKWEISTIVKNYQTRQSTPDFKTKSKPSKEFQSHTVSKTEDKVFYIQNAGIVLLHPFLQRFFGRFELLENGEFKDHDAVSRAIHLLHYIATQTTEPDEHDLSLLKLLCGIPLNVPVKKRLQISDEEKEEADALLQAVINHWGALGEVSNASLQESFLQREGKLLKEETGWKLQIEKKTMDILLNQLPWNLSVIKLPWMQDFLKVDWI